MKYLQQHLHRQAVSQFFCQTQSVAPHQTSACLKQKRQVTEEKTYDYCRSKNLLKEDFKDLLLYNYDQDVNKFFHCSL